MYNRYIPQSEDYGPIPPEDHRRAGPSPSGEGARPGGLLNRLFQGGLAGGDGLAQALSSLLQGLGLGELDAGDILLGLIVLFLLLEDGDDLDLVIALALALVFSLGEP